MEMGKSTKEKNRDVSNDGTAARSEAKAEPTVKDRRPKNGEKSQKNNQTDDGPKVRVRDKRYWVQDEGGAERDSESVDLERKPTYVTQLEKKIEERDRKLKEYIAAYKQKMAETDEIRARLEKKMEEQADQRFAKLVEKLLPIIDNFSLALDSTQKNQDF